eukprot:3627773-Pleurochrysis_carterae.AAC.2
MRACIRACVRVRARACVRVRVRARACVLVRARACVRVRVRACEDHVLPRASRHAAHVCDFFSIVSVSAPSTALYRCAVLSVMWHESLRTD